MERYRPYRGRSGVSRRRRSTATGHPKDKSTGRTVRLLVCVGLFVVAAFMKLVFPAALQTVGDKLNSVVNYRAALATLGEGISGEKKFTAALGEAFTYAFTGASPAPSQSPDPAGVSAEPSPSGTVTGNGANGGGGVSPGTDDTIAANASASGDETVQVFSEQTQAEPSSGTIGEGDAGVSDDGKTFSDAVIAAFLQNQEQYSDYAVPAGVSYGMPKIGTTYVKPVEGVVSSPFGFRVHPIDKTVKFHYGTDISAEIGTPIVAFSDGKVIAAGESATLGKYVILSRSGLETEYAHCDKLFVKTGQAVKMGDKIAALGSTGNATEPCLHFELRVNGICVNPEFYVQWT